MAAVDNTAAAAYMKQRFSPKRIRSLTLPRGPLYAQMPKKTDFGGTDLKLPVTYADLKGASATFSVAQANKAGTDDAAFQITTTADYALFSIKGKTIRETRGQLNAWLPALEKNAKSAFKVLGRRCSIGVYRTSLGAISTIHADTTLSTTTLKFANRSDMSAVEKGGKFGLVNPAATTAYRDSDKMLTVVSVDRDAQTAVMSAAIDTISGATAADHIVPEGDLNLRFTGLAGWLPATAPTAGDSHFSVDRSADAVRLAGIRYNGQGKNLEVVFINMLKRVDEEGGQADCIFTTPDIWAKTVIQLGSRVQYTTGNARYFDSKKGNMADARIGFKGIVITGPAGDAVLYADRYCQANTAYALEMDSWTFHSSGECPGWLDEDDNEFLREATDDAYEGRTGLYANIHCDAPGYNLVASNVGA